MKAGGSQLSKSILNNLEKNAQILVKSRKDLTKYSKDEAMIKGQIELEAEGFTKPLLYKSISELKRISVPLITRYTEIALKDNQNEEVTEEIQLLQHQILILEKAIQIKQKQNRQLSHNMERNFIDHPFISSSSPNEETLQKQRKKDGSLEVNKTGFRNMHYNNSNGKLLLPTDARNMLGIFKLWEQKGKNQSFEFTFNELLKCVQVEAIGGEYNNLFDSLSNLGQTSIVMEEFFDAEAKKRMRTKIHNPFQDMEIDRTTNTVSVMLSNNLHKNLLIGNVVPISISLFNDLASPTSRALYLILVNKAKDGDLMLDVEQLLPHLGLHSSEKSKAYSHMQRAFEELQSFDVIQSFDIVRKERRVPVQVRFIPSDWLLQADSMDNQLQFNTPTLLG